MGYLTPDQPALGIARHMAEMLKNHYSEIGFLNDPRGIDPQVGFVAANAGEEKVSGTNGTAVSAA